MRRGTLPRLLVVRSDRLPGPLMAGHGLDALRPGRARGARVAVEPPAVLEDAAQLLLGDADPAAVLVADADDLPVGDAGLLRRWVEASEDRRLVLVGTPGGARRLEQAGAPVDELLPWLEPAAALPAARHGHPDADLSAIEAILRSGPAAEEASPANGNGNGNGHHPTAPRSEDQASRVARRFTPRPGSPPRSAFLRSPIRPGGADAPPPARVEPPTASAPAPASPTRDAFDASEPLLTKEELDAFFGPLDGEVDAGPTAGLTVEPALDQPPAPEFDQEVEDALEAATAELDAIAELLEAQDLDALEAEPLPHDEEAGVLEGDLEEDEAAVEALELVDELSEPTHEEPASDDHSVDLVEEEDGDAHAAGVVRPPWLKRQIADLADMVQALELRARTNHAHVGMEAELGRLRQFCRTLGLVASPPAHRGQSFDLAVHVEEQLGQLAGASPDAPRILFRTRGEEPTVIADKGLVACAVDAVLQTALACGGSGDVVRVQVVADDEAITLDVEFPPGPLVGRAPSEVMEPYGIRDVLPEIGANALAAAGAIAVGQGGDLLMGEREGGAMGFTLELARPVEGA